MQVDWQVSLRSPYEGERLCASRLVEPSSSVTSGAAGAPTQTDRHTNTGTPATLAGQPLLHIGHSSRRQHDGLLATMMRLSLFPRDMTVLGRVIVSTHCLINFVNIPLLPWKCSMADICDAKNHRHLPRTSSSPDLPSCVFSCFTQFPLQSAVNNISLLSMSFFFERLLIGGIIVSLFFI